MTLGLILAGVGGEAFLRGAVGLSRWAKIPASLVALTVAAFATSSPELSVGITSALAGHPQIALGDGIGSNVVNITFVLGLGTAIAPAIVSVAGVRRDIPAALLQPLLLAALAYDATISRVDALLMLSVFAVWLCLIIKEALEHRNEARQPPSRTETPAPGGKSTALILGGLVLLCAAGKVLVTGGREMGQYFGLSPFVTGATIVAMCTSLPELATTVVASMRGHSDVALGTILGSNIFNGLFIIPLAALIHPIDVHFAPLLTGLTFGVACVLSVLPPKSLHLKRGRGIVLLGLYAAYLFFVLNSHQVQ
jgi:cation:H+ antiporter